MRNQVFILAAWIALAQGCGSSGSSTIVSSPGPGASVLDAPLARVTGIHFDPGYLEPFEGVADPSGGYAYFGTISNPAQIIRVRLSDFSIQGRIDLDLTEDQIRSAVIDSVNGFAYFGLATYPGKIIKIRLSDFTRVGTLTLGAGEGGLRSAVLDPVRGMAYFGTQMTPGRVIRVRLSDFTRLDAVSLDPVENDLHSLVLDSPLGLLYAGTGNVTLDGSGAAARVVKIDVSNPSGPMVRVGSLTMNADEQVLGAAALDSATGFAYFGTRNNTNPGGSLQEQIIRVNLNSFTRVDAIQLGMGEGYIRGAHVDSANDLAYFTLTMAPAKVVKVRLSTFNRAGNLVLADKQRPRCSVFDPANRALYLGFNMFPIRLTRVNLTTFSEGVTVSGAFGENGTGVVRVDPRARNVFVGTGGFPGKIVKFKSSDLSRTSEFLLNAIEENGVRSGAIDAERGVGYFGIAGATGYPDRIIKLDLGTMTRLATLVLGSEELAAGLAIDPTTGVLYAGIASPYSGSTSTAIGKVTRIVPATLTRDTTLTFSSFLFAHPSSLFLDPVGHFLYLNSDSNLLKINLTSFTVVAAVSPGVSLGPGTLEPGGAYLYFAGSNPANNPNPDLIRKFRTSDLTQVASLLLGTGEYQVHQISYDPLLNFLYAVTGVSPSRVIKLNPANFSRLGQLDLSPGESGAWDGDIDPAGNHLYVGTNTAPGQLIKVRISRPAM